MGTFTSNEEVQPSDLTALPTLFIMMNDHGDVVYRANNENIDILTALGMIELAKTKMTAQHYASVHAQKQREAATATILVPSARR